MLLFGENVIEYITLEKKVVKLEVNSLSLVQVTK